MFKDDNASVRLEVVYLFLNIASKIINGTLASTNFNVTSNNKSIIHIIDKTWTYCKQNTSFTSKSEQ